MFLCCPCVKIIFSNKDLVVMITVGLAHVLPNAISEATLSMHGGDLSRSAGNVRQMDSDEIEVLVIHSFG